MRKNEDKTIRIKLEKKSSAGSKSQHTCEIKLSHLTSRAHEPCIQPELGGQLSELSQG